MGCEMVGGTYLRGGGEMLALKGRWAIYLLPLRFVASGMRASCTPPPTKPLKEYVEAK